MKMQNLSGPIIVACCSLWMPVQALAADQGKDVTQTPVARTPEAVKTTEHNNTTKVNKPFRDCNSCPRLVLIPAGNFVMGSPDANAGHAEEGRGEDEGPMHNVRIAAVAFGQTEVTRGEFAEFVKSTKYSVGDKCWALKEGKFEEISGLNWRNPGFPQTDKHPVTCVNWDDATAYTKWLSRKTGKHYRLPTEAEWEFAARGGTTTARYWGDKPDDACAYANTGDKTVQAAILGASSWTVHQCTDGYVFTAPVGSFKANDVGLYDMLGNVWEWTEESYHPNYINAPTDASIWQGDGEKRTLRGGSWNNGPRNVRAAVRNSNDPRLRFSIFGFRVVRDIR